YSGDPFICLKDVIHTPKHPDDLLIPKLLLGNMSGRSNIDKSRGTQSPVMLYSGTDILAWVGVFIAEDRKMSTTDPLFAPIETAVRREIGGVQLDVVKAGGSRVKR